MKQEKARNQHHDGSDVDIYVEMPPKFFLIVRLKAYLEAPFWVALSILSESTSTSTSSCSKKLREMGLK